MDCKNLPPCVGNQEECLCFTDFDSPDPSTNQFCGYIDRDGVTVHPCSQNCCNGGLGCPGQCRGVTAKRPDAVRDLTGKRKTQVNTVFNDHERIIAFENIFKFLVFLLILSSFSLFLRA